MRAIIERPFLFVAIAYSAGIVLGTLSRFFISWPWYAFLSLLSFSVLIFIRNHKVFLPLALIFLLSLGAMSYQINQIVPAQDVSNPEFHGRGSLQGIIISEVDQKTKGKKEIISFTLRAESWFSAKQKITMSGNVRVTLLNSNMVPSYGDEVRIKGDLSYPKSAMNPGEFDYRDYLEKQNIRASFLGFGHHSLRIIGRGKGIVRRIFDFRRAIHDRVYGLASFPERDILLSLLTGERSGIPREITDDFVRTGTVHVIAISGFQVSLVAGFIFFLLRWLGVSMRIAAIISAVVLLIYVPLAGWQLPVQRAGIMGIVILGAVMLSRGSDVISSIFFAFFVLLVLNPNHLYSVAFQLSFISVLAILRIVPLINEWLKTDIIPEKSNLWTQAVRNAKLLFASTLAAMVGTFPLILYYFHVFSLTSILANFIIVPLTTFALFSLIFVLPVSLVSIQLAGFLMKAPIFFAQTAIQTAHILGKFPLSFIYLPSPHWSMLIFYYAFLVIFITGFSQSWHPAMKRGLALGFLGILIGLILPVFKTHEEIIILNVPGSSVIFAEDRSGHKILFNGGKGESSSQDYWTVIPFLKARGIKKIDQVFVTSMKRKFWGGLVRISDHCRFVSMIVPWPYARDKSFEDLINKIRKQRGSFQGLVAGNRFLISESTRVEVLDLQQSRFDSNVLLLIQGKIRILMLEENVRPDHIQKLPPKKFEIIYLNAKGGMRPEMMHEIIRLGPQVVILANLSASESNVTSERLFHYGIKPFTLEEAGALTLRQKADIFEVSPFSITTYV